MKKLIKVLVFAGILAAAIFLLPAADDKPAVKSTAVKGAELFPDRVVARGKGFELKQSEVEEAFASIRSRLAAAGQPLAEEQRGAVETNLINEMIFTKLLMARATEADKTKAKELAEKYFSDIKSQMPSEDAFNLRLKALGLTPDQFRSQTLEQATRQEVIKREVTPGVVITPEQVKKFYDDNPSKFEQPESVRLSHILFVTRDPQTQQLLPVEKIKAKETLAKKVRDQAAAGDDFAALADANSEDPLVKTNHGEINLTRGQVPVPEFETAAFSLKTNQISTVVESSLGFHVIKVHEKIPAKKIELTTVEKDIREFLTQQELQKLIPDYFEKLKRDGGVEMVGAADPAKTGTPELK